MIVSSFSYLQSCLWSFFSRGPFELQSHRRFLWGYKTSHRKICVRTIRYRGATSIVDAILSPTSLTCLTTGCTIKVCSPNFYCFKFIIINASAHFKIHHCLFRNHHKLPWKWEKSLLFWCLEAIIAPASDFVNKILKVAEMFGFYISHFLLAIVLGDTESLNKPDKPLRYWSTNHLAQRHDWHWTRDLTELDYIQSTSSWQSRSTRLVCDSSTRAIAREVERPAGLTKILAMFWRMTLMSWRALVIWTKIHHRIKRNQQDDDATEMLNTRCFHTWLWLLG